MVMLALRHPFGSSSNCIKGNYWISSKYTSILTSLSGSNLFGGSLIPCVSQIFVAWYISFVAWFTYYMVHLYSWAHIYICSHSSMVCIFSVEACTKSIVEHIKYIYMDCIIVVFISLGSSFFNSTHSPKVLWLALSMAHILLWLAHFVYGMHLIELTYITSGLLLWFVCIFLWLDGLW